MNSLSSARLTPTQVEQYKTEGYIVVTDPVFPEPKFQALREHFDRKLANLEENVRPESMDVPHFTDTRLFDWLLSDEALDLVEPLIGPDIALFSSHFICKLGGRGKRVPWHEDSAYWRGMLDPMEVATIWLAIDPSTPENGGMHVIPRTQHNGYSDYEPVDPEKNVFRTEIVKAQRDESRIQACILQPNQCSIHDGRLIHGSPPNTSSIRRCGYTMRYMPSYVKFNKAQFGHHQVYLARGRDRSGTNQYADPTKSYPELARFREKSGKNGH